MSAQHPLATQFKPDDLFLTFREWFDMWCTERHQNPANYDLNAMESTFNLFIESDQQQPSQSWSQFAAKQKEPNTTVLSRAYQIIDELALQGEYNQLMKREEGQLTPTFDLSPETTPATSRQSSTTVNANTTNNSTTATASTAATSESTVSKVDTTVPDDSTTGPPPNPASIQFLESQGYDRAKCIRALKLNKNEQDALQWLLLEEAKEEEQQEATTTAPVSTNDSTTSSSSATPPSQENPHHPKIVFVGNLAYQVDEAALRAAFASCGEIANVRVAMDRDNKSKGFGHVEFVSEEGATAAIKCNRKEVCGRQIRVDYAEPHTKIVAKPVEVTKTEVVKTEVVAVVPDISTAPSVPISIKSAQSSSTIAVQQAPVFVPAIGDATAFLKTVKTRFPPESGTVYKEFTDILHDFKTGKLTGVETSTKLTQLFKDDADLLGSLSLFLPKEAEAKTIPNIPTVIPPPTAPSMPVAVPVNPPQAPALGSRGYGNYAQPTFPNTFGTPQFTAASQFQFPQPSTPFQTPYRQQVQSPSYPFILPQQQQPFFQQGQSAYNPPPNPRLALQGQKYLPHSNQLEEDRLLQEALEASRVQFFREKSQTAKKIELENEQLKETLRKSSIPEPVMPKLNLIVAGIQKQQFADSSDNSTVFLSAKSMKVLEVVEGDTILLQTPVSGKSPLKEQLMVVIEDSSPEGVDSQMIRLWANSRGLLGAPIGSHIFVSRADNVPGASKLALELLYDPSTITALTNEQFLSIYLKPYFHDSFRPLVMGDEFDVAPSEESTDFFTCGVENLPTRRFRVIGMSNQAQTRCVVDAETKLQLTSIETKESYRAREQQLIEFHLNATQGETQAEVKPTQPTTTVASTTSTSSDAPVKFAVEVVTVAKIEETVTVPSEHGMIPVPAKPIVVESKPVVATPTPVLAADLGDVHEVAAPAIPTNATTVPIINPFATMTSVVSGSASSVITPVVESMSTNKDKKKEAKKEVKIAKKSESMAAPGGPVIHPALRAFQNDLEEAQSSKASLEEQLAVSEAELTKLRTTIQQKDVALASKDAALAQAAIFTNTLQQQLADCKVSDKDQLIKQLRLQLADEKTQNLVAHKRIAELVAEGDARVVSKKSPSDELVALRAEKAELARTLQQVLNDGEMARVQRELRALQEKYSELQWSVSVEKSMKDTQVKARELKCFQCSSRIRDSNLELELDLLKQQPNAQPPLAKRPSISAPASSAAPIIPSSFLSVTVDPKLAKSVDGFDLIQADVKTPTAATTTATTPAVSSSPLVVSAVTSASADEDEWAEDEDWAATKKAAESAKTPEAATTTQPATTSSSSTATSSSSSAPTTTGSKLSPLLRTVLTSSEFLVCALDRGINHQEVIADLRYGKDILDKTPIDTTEVNDAIRTLLDRGHLYFESVTDESTSFKVTTMKLRQKNLTDQDHTRAMAAVILAYLNKLGRAFSSDELVEELESLDGGNHKLIPTRLVDEACMELLNRGLIQFSTVKDKSIHGQKTLWSCLPNSTVVQQ